MTKPEVPEPKSAATQNPIPEPKTFYFFIFLGGTSVVFNMM